MAKVVLPKSDPAGLILVAKSGPPGPYLSAKSGPTLPKTVRYSLNEFVLNKTRKACPSIFFSYLGYIIDFFEAGAMYMYVDVIYGWNKSIVQLQNISYCNMAIWSSSVYFLAWEKLHDPDTKQCLRWDLRVAESYIMVLGSDPKQRDVAKATAKRPQLLQSCCR